MLLVEDDVERVRWFAEHGGMADILTCCTVPGAIRELSLVDFNELWLDHDLGTEPLSGRDVALWLVAHPENNPFLAIRTHTVNVVSGPKIVRDLRAAGRSAEWVPFHDLVAMEQVR